MDAIQLLKQDHEKVKQLFQQTLTAEPKKAKTLFDQIYHELTIHAIIEEQVFYPTTARFPQLKSLLKDAYQEHAEAKQSLGEISNLDSSSPEWKTKVEKLSKAIDHHVKDEEEKLFPKVQEIMPAQDLQKLGQELQQAKSAKLDSTLLSQPLPLENQATL